MGPISLSTPGNSGDTRNHDGVDYVPVLNVDPEQEDTNEDVPKPTEEYVNPERRWGDNVAQMAAMFGAIAIVICTWVIVFSNKPFTLGWFFWHPILQSLSIMFFTFGITTLQPTALPSTKAAGLALHQRAMFYLGFPAILLGVSAMWLNKYIHAAPHATTWHGVFGYVTISWMVIQVLIGGCSVWFDGRLLGGNPRAKMVWKYHRLSGYLLFPLLLMTVHLGGGWSDWVTMNSLYALRFLAYTIGPIVLFVGLFARIRPSKMRFF